MAMQREGFPYWELIYDADGSLVPSGADSTLLSEVNETRLSDLFLFSHGWNNDQKQARDLYDRFFREMKKLLDDPTIRKPHPALIGTVGVIWPSMRWADEAVPTGATAAAAGLGGPPSNAELVLGLKDVFTEPVQQQALDEMATLLASRPPGDEPLARFQALMRQLDTRILGGETPAQANAADAQEDNGERCGLLESPAREVFTRFAELARPPANEGGAAGLRDVLGAIWDGAKETLRTTTYWQMKRRAGVVGMRGVGPLIGRLRRERPDLRVHLLGHSFGGRVVAFALAGLPPDALSSKSPVKSVALLQGAFSHFAFAPMLPPTTPHAAARSRVWRAAWTGP